MSVFSSINWAAVLKVICNVGGAFVAGYSGASASGLPTKVAIGAGVIAAVTNQVGLHQDPPAKP